ncbi:MAG: hypothetical protein GY832_22150 [Chloroflexi bacterium]|nr:hypothetical protein [Chloroflexota bacterium]
MNVREIVEAWLKENGYDGLCGEECGCRIGDIGACDYVEWSCVPGYACPHEACIDACEEHVSYRYKPGSCTVSPEWLAEHGGKNETTSKPTSANVV